MLSRFALCRGFPTGADFVWRHFACAVLLASIVLPIRAQVHRIDSAPPELLESGVPPFAVFGTEALGLSSPATDLHILPDGRLLLFAARQIVLGDGVRWDLFPQAPTEKTLSTLGVAVDHDGKIYMGYPGGFARVDFGEDGLWRATSVAPWPPNENPNRPVPRMAIVVGDEWFWHSGSGSVIAWHPGQTSRVAGEANMVENIFSFKNNLYLSEQTEGELYRLHGEKMEIVSTGSVISAENAITAAKPYDANSILVGTYGNGLQLFDGQKTRPLLQRGVLASGLRINDLCETEGNLYGAAVENYGIVFFDHQGRTVQVLDRALDHRLAHVKKLLATPGGVIWALLDDGLLRVEFPTRVSHFEPIIGTGITTAHPYRYEGKLWIMADGKVSRGVYDDEGRLTHFVADTPSNRHAFSFSIADKFPIVGTARGAFYQDGASWKSFAPESDNLRVLDTFPRNDRWIYGAKNEMGWLKTDHAHQVTTERFDVPDLKNVFNSTTDKHGDLWLELGNGRVGRVRVENGRPVLRTFDEHDGVPDGWAQVFEIDGTVGFNIGDQIIRFDETSERFVPDAEFHHRFPGLTEIVGRPGLDANGRLWITANGSVQVFEKRDDAWQNVYERMPPGFRPIYFTFEKNGMVWMHADRHLARFDPALPVASPVLPRAIITHVNLVARNRTVFDLTKGLAPLDFSDNSINVHFMAPGNPFATPVTFEVKLEGAGNEWVSNGATGSAVFNRLKEGHYVLHVRPRSGDVLGAEALLSFTIRPPWFRSPLAYVAYSASALATILFSLWLITFLQRGKNARLESLVALRTGELRESNLLLAKQVEEIRMLSQAIGQSPVSVIITKPDNAIVFANPRAAELSGYDIAELIGQKTRLLRSEMVSDELIDEITATVQRGESWHGQLANRRKQGGIVHVRTTISPIRSPDGQIRLHLILEEDITEWLADQERRRKLEGQLFQSQKLESVGTLAGGIAHDFNNILTGILGYCELARFNVAPGTELMSQLLEIRTAGMRAKDLVSQILTFSRRGTAELVPIDLAKPVGEALRLIRASTPATIAISSQLESGVVRADSTQIQQVVLNLCTNAVHAMGDKTGRLDVSLQRVQVDRQLAAEVPDLVTGSFLRLTVSDNGHGMNQATLDRIFDPFFTTKQQGEGTGLGLSIVQGILAGHQGAMRVRSKIGEGSTFDLYFPLCNEKANSSAPTEPSPRGESQEILVVDDEPAVATFVTARLQQLGFRVVTFRDPREALAAYRGTPMRFQAIVTDLTMPHMTGVDLIQRVRALGREIPAVIVTGYGRDAGGAKLGSLPRCQVLYKPFSGEDLVRILNSVLDGDSTPTT